MRLGTITGIFHIFHGWSTQQIRDEFQLPGMKVVMVSYDGDQGMDGWMGNENRDWMRCGRLGEESLELG